MVGDAEASEHAFSCSDLSVLFQVCILGMRKVARMTVKPTKGNFSADLVGLIFQLDSPEKERNC